MYLVLVRDVREWTYTHAASSDLELLLHEQSYSRVRVTKTVHACTTVYMYQPKPRCNLYNKLQMHCLVILTASTTNTNFLGSWKKDIISTSEKRIFSGILLQDWMRKIKINKSSLHPNLMSSSEAAQRFGLCRVSLKCTLWCLSLLHFRLEYAPSAPGLLREKLATRFKYEPSEPVPTIYDPQILGISRI